MLNVSRSTVRNELRRKRRREAAAAGGATRSKGEVIAKLNQRQHGRIIEQARNRNVDVNRLASLIVATVIDDDMIDAVLDDEGDA